MSSSKRVLFVCSHNSNRSIAAEAIARKERADLVVASAGVDAAGVLNMKMVEALNARGYPTEGLRSKTTEEVGGLSNNWDYIIMMGCLAGLPSPVPSTSTVENWGLPDPAANPAILHEVIDKIIDKVRVLGLKPSVSPADELAKTAKGADFITAFLGSNKIALFSKSYCPYCKKVKGIFTESGIVPSIVELDLVEGGEEIQKALVPISGRSTVPQVFIKGQFVGGSEEVASLHESGKLLELIKA